MKIQSRFCLLLILAVVAGCIQDDGPVDENTTGSEPVAMQDDHGVGTDHLAEGSLDGTPDETTSPVDPSVAQPMTARTSAGVEEDAQEAVVDSVTNQPESGDGDEQNPETEDVDTVRGSSAIAQSEKPSNFDDETEHSESVTVKSTEPATTIAETGAADDAMSERDEFRDSVESESAAEPESSVVPDPQSRLKEVAASAMDAESEAGRESSAAGASPEESKMVAGGAEVEKDPSKDAVLSAGSAAESRDADVLEPAASTRLEPESASGTVSDSARGSTADMQADSSSASRNA